MRINGNAIRPGNVVEHKGGLWRAVKIAHTQPGKGGAYLQVELRNLRDGSKLNERFRASENVEKIRLDQKDHQFLFGDGDSFTFMDVETYEQVELNGERRGLVPSKEWKLATRGERWQLGETVISGIGQGFLLATPLQLALMTARLANGGVLVKPTLVREQGEIQEPASLKINPASLKVVLEGMNAVVNGARGTAKKAAPKGVDYKLAGKTGTAQVRRITRSERLSGVVKNEDLPWRERDHALFVAFAPYDAPRYATAVVIEHGGSASRVAITAPFNS